MSGPMSPRVLKAGIVLIDPDSGQVQRVISLQYNPDSLQREYAIASHGDGGERSEAMRLKGPPVETITLEAEIDATDQLETSNGTALELGIHPQLAALEVMVYPASQALQSNLALASMGMLEIVPMEAPLALFVWSKNRVMPVRVTSFSVAEEAFDANLNPVRATVSLTLRVLSVDDLGFKHRGGSLFMSYLANKEGLAARSPSGTLSTLGLERLP
ncbi:MAG: hypothetical protein M0R73_02380 [Dehalococcoidia bacterium]|nr:hypothetical protein [Dehalococcoidia bacterium]